MKKQKRFSSEEEINRKAEYTEICRDKLAMIIQESIAHGREIGLREAAEMVHDMSRGTKSEDRAIAIDEARDLILDSTKRNHDTHH